MKTYEDLLECGESDKERGEFCLAAIRAFESTDDYQTAYIADRYYHNHNVTIENYVKWLYTVTGKKVEDVFSANYKLKNGFFRTGTIQHANYLLGNGVVFETEGIKDKVGKTFDHEIIKGVKMAIVEKVAYLYWNTDHVEAFGYCCTDSHAGFCPLHTLKDGKLMAGISFKYRVVANKTLTYMTLYEPDGVTEYMKNKDDEIVVLKQKYKYKKRSKKTKAEGVIYSEDINYDGVLPIVPMYVNDTYASELIGRREKIDCYDLVESGLANNLEDAAEIFWVFKNAGGMNDPSLAKLLERIRKTHAIGIDSEDGGGAEPHTMDVPYESREALLDRLRTELYEDWMLLDRRSMSAAQKTEQELQMAYQPMDDYTDDLEYHVMETLDAVLSLAGVNSDYHFIRNKSCNMTEQTNMVLSAANYISPECVIKHLPFLTPEEADEEIAKYQDREMEQFRDMGNDETEDEETEDDTEEEE